MNTTVLTRNKKAIPSTAKIALRKQERKLKTKLRTHSMGQVVGKLGDLLQQSEIEGYINALHDGVDTPQFSNADTQKMVEWLDSRMKALEVFVISAVVAGVDSTRR